MVKQFKKNYVKENDIHLNFEWINKINNLEFSRRDLFIIPTFNIFKKKLYLYQMFKGLNNVKLIVSSKINSIEELILYINFQLERKNMTK